MDEGPLQITDADVGHGTVSPELWHERVAARAVIVRDGKVALMHARRDDYYKLPGGGVDPDESVEEACIREVREETGLRVRLGERVGETIELRSGHGLKQRSICFLAAVVSEGEPELEEGERAEGFVMEWVPVGEAVARIQNNQKKRYQGPFIRARDAYLLQEGLKRV